MKRDDVQNFLFLEVLFHEWVRISQCQGVLITAERSRSKRLQGAMTPQSWTHFQRYGVPRFATLGPSKP